jgi:predicted ArsR family transcriptional regulator
MSAMLNDRTPQGLADLALLADPVRRALYLHVASQPEAVGREEAAAAVGIGRPLAAHHLDRLVEAGLLIPEYRRRSGRTGPGAGRPSKLYRPSTREIAAALPQRRYQVAADLFAAALEPPSSGLATLEEVAHRRGEGLGKEARRRAGRGAGRRRRQAAMESVLREAGYLPLTTGGELRMLNCPFHELAQAHRQVTCGMNLALIRGMLAGAGLAEDAARLDPQPGTCCVVISEGRPSAR